MCGEQIQVAVKENGKSYNCKVSKIEDLQVECDIVEENAETTESNIEITIFQGLPKQEKMEYIIQKSVELGVKEIVPVKLNRCVVKIDSKSEPKKIDRWNKISEAAAKQSNRDYIPKVTAIACIKDIIEKVDDYDIILLAYEQERENKLKCELKKLKTLKTEGQKIKIGIVIGPEGGIADEEKKQLNDGGIKNITLGKRILRTETVALNVISVSMYELEEY